MRLLLCTDTLNDVNGVCRFIRNVAEHQHRRGRDVTVLTSTSVSSPIAELQYPNVVNVPPLWTRPMPGYPQLQLAIPPLIKVVSLARQLRPDVVHLSTPGPVGWAGLVASRVIGCPVVGVYHTDFPSYVEKLFGDDGMTGLTRGAMKAFYRRFAAVLCRSEEYRSALLGLGVSADRLLTLKAGVDINTFHAKHRDVGVWSELGLREHSVKILSVGRVSIEKNLSFLMNVWKVTRQRLTGRGIDADLVIVGDGPYRATMEQECRGLNVHFLGFRFGEMLARLYASSDIFVFPSTTDTLGQVAMESQASGLPVLVSDQGGPKMVVKNGVTGLVLPAGHVEVWSNALEELCANPARRKQMGAAAHQAMQEMTIEESLEDFWRVHERVIQSSSQRVEGSTAFRTSM